VMGGKDHAWCADAALGSTLFEETLLNGVEFLVDNEALDGGDLGAFGLQDGDEAGVDELAVDQNGAGSALAFAATFFGSGEVQIFAEDIKKPLHGGSGYGSFVAIDGALNGCHAVDSLKIGPATAGFRSSFPPVA
jgi:hypothetical protein